MPLLEVEHVSRHFGGVMAVDDVSLSLAEGEILGLIGPNGAGKSTLFNLMSVAMEMTGIVMIELKRMGFS
jgi:branched-chain amino acid transport system ATP-binding protein